MKQLVSRLRRIALFTAIFLSVGVVGISHANTPVAPPTYIVYAAVPAAPALAGCVVSGPAMLICGGVIVTVAACYMYCDDIADWFINLLANRKNARPSTKYKHEMGEARRQRDQRRKAEYEKKKKKKKKKR